MRVGSIAQVTGAAWVASRTRLTRDPSASASLQAVSRLAPRAPKRLGSGSSVSGTAQLIEIGSYCFACWYPPNVRTLVEPVWTLRGTAP